MADNKMNWAALAAKNAKGGAQQNQPDFFYNYPRKVVSMNTLLDQYPVQGANWVKTPVAEHGSISFGPFPNVKTAQTMMNVIDHVTVVPNKDGQTINNIHLTDSHDGSRKYIYDPNTSNPGPDAPPALQQFHKEAFFTKQKMMKAVAPPLPAFKKAVDPFPALGAMKKVVPAPPLAGPWGKKGK